MAVSGKLYAQAPVFVQSRKPRSKPVIASAASTTAESTSSVESEFCSARATSTKRAKFRQIAGAGRSGFRGGELIEQFLNLVVVKREDQAVGIGKAELDAVGRVQLLPSDARSVDEYAVAALQVLDVVFAVFTRRIRAWLRDARLSRRTRWLSAWRPMVNGTGVIGTRLRFPDG